MVEVFRTNVTDAAKAEAIIKEIHRVFINYRANFDLEDCDLILRIENPEGLILALEIIALLEKNGFIAEVLEDLVFF